MSRELGEFLRSRRARIKPTDVGLPAGLRRRVPGLRRDEVASLAGVSVEYYVRLEQGRTAGVSDSVLDAVGRALRLSAVERTHLGNLVRPADGDAGPNRVPPTVQRLLDLMDTVPAAVLGKHLDVLAYNRLADAVCGFSAHPAAERNMARQTFLNPTAHLFYPEWDRVAAETVAYLRLEAGRWPDDAGLAALVGELSIKNEVFRRLWARHDVKDKVFGRKVMNHDLVGELEVEWQMFALPGDVGQHLLTYIPVAGSGTADKLAVLASWTASTPRSAQLTS
ncbi:helix-turn-helix transcriptional regulator [Umezawaea endophytica]|uniref:Helix-turn-helix transcriptional regulator n=1 Tax=Umezawaea endophytica TaxID=1654476 RepID=A0A9X3AJ54_9PSEU|nr:helix-turn-helix transcriptional regulator [Umezawaea endophytica]MCS7481320.1 helix-turn-helix transcriptional regulator [Umezawaea endophytica]